MERPWHAIMQLSLFMLVLFAVGTLPWVDNWAHLFGFIFGFLVSLGELFVVSPDIFHFLILLLDDVLTNHSFSFYLISIICYVSGLGLIFFSIIIMHKYCEGAKKNA